MNLIDFTNHPALNALRDKMNALLVVNWETSSWTGVDAEGLLRRLNSLEGIEVDINEIIPSKNGTFEYKGQKVLVYIRDQYFNFRHRGGGYKFHIANCDTMKKAFQTGRQDRYVVSTRTDGRFLVNVRKHSSKIEELRVCKNCLLKLHYKGYNHPKGRSIYEKFSLSEFFQQYGGT